MWESKLDDGLHSAVKQPDGPYLAAALANGSVVFVDATDGGELARSDDAEELEPPNVLAFAAQHERILTFEINEANNWCLPQPFLLVLLPFPSEDVLL